MFAAYLHVLSVRASRSYFASPEVTHHVVTLAVDHRRVLRGDMAPLDVYATYRRILEDSEEVSLKFMSLFCMTQD